MYDCRICFCEGDNPNDFISPCCCTGTALHVHKECLNRWLLTNHGTKNYFECKECNCKYKRAEPENKDYIIDREVAIGSLLSVSLSSIILIGLILFSGISKIACNIVLILLFFTVIFYTSLNGTFSSYAYFIFELSFLFGFYSSSMKIKTFVTDLFLIIGFLVLSINLVDDYWEDFRRIIEKTHLRNFKADMYDNFLQKYVSGLV